MKQGLFFVFSLIVLTSICDTVNQLFLKTAVNSLKAPVSFNLRSIVCFILKLLSIPRVWLGGIFSLLSLCIWLFVLARADLNFAFSLDSMHYIFIAVVSKTFLKEKVGLGRWIGTLFIVIGIVLVTLS